MEVNSLQFVLFFVVVFVAYYGLAATRKAWWQNLLLVLASYAFYAMCDVRMVPLLAGATVVFYGVGRWLQSLMRRERWQAASHVTTLGVVLGVALLLYFKYLNFFGESITALLQVVGLKASWTTLNIVVPVGVSFFTFKLISYIVEIHREHVDGDGSFIDFAAYVSFFPTLMSGPIDRPGKFLPQLSEVHHLDYGKAVDGCRQVLWGVFMKMCIADVLCVLVDQAWTLPTERNASYMLMAVVLYPIQLYADFAGYSHMAIGVGKVLGFDIARNFNTPFFARNIAEYWRRWHMSLTSWITDYVFMPLNIAMRNWDKWGLMLAVTINMVVIGMWHGASWTYLVFGLYYSALFIPLVFNGTFAKRKKLKPGKWGLPQRSDLWRMLGTYCLLIVGQMIFRAPSLTSLGDAISWMASGSVILSPHPGLPLTVYAFVVLLIVVEWFTREHEHALQQLEQVALFKSRAARWALYYGLIAVIYLCQGSSHGFAYFQF